MKKRYLRGIAFALAGLVLAAHAQDAQYATILQQPLDQCIPLGGTATYSVVATNATGIQWLFNGATMDGQTNNSITVSNANINNVGYYSAFIYRGADAVPTRSAALQVYLTSGTGSPTSSTTSTTTMTASTLTTTTTSSSLIVYATPVQSSGGGGTSCPGPYSGYVNYIPSTGWGFVPSTSTTVYNATDTNQTTTRVQYLGAYGDNGCAQTTVTVPYPTMSPQYRFTIYFPTNAPVPTNAYPIVLNGFNQ